MKKVLCRAAIFLAAAAGLLLSGPVSQAQKNQGTTGKAVTVTGTVLDDSGSPSIGVTVLIKGTSTGTSTDIDGHYQIVAPPQRGSRVLMHGIHRRGNTCRRAQRH